MWEDHYHFLLGVPLGRHTGWIKAWERITKIAFVFGCEGELTDQPLGREEEKISQGYRHALQKVIKFFLITN